jgi:hypothetical protein
MLVQDRALLFLWAYSSISYGLLWAFLSSFPTFFTGFRHFNFIVASFIPDISILIGVLVMGTPTAATMNRLLGYVKLANCFLKKDWKICALPLYFFPLDYSC